jgi:hypothetical protein
MVLKGRPDEAPEFVGKRPDQAYGVENIIANWMG